MKDKKFKGSITVEAALVTPLFTACVLFFIFFFRIMSFELELQSAIGKAAENLASYGYILNKAESLGSSKKDELLDGIPLGNLLFNCIAGCADDYALKAVTAEYIDKKLAEQANVEGGWSGINFAGSTLRDSEDCVSITVHYTVKLPFVLKIIPGLSVEQRAAAGLFSGQIAGNTSKACENTVYVAKNGTVYHTSLDCTYLKLSTKEVPATTVSSLRNIDGGKYYRCELCGNKKNKGDSVYITDDGDRYHYLSDCIALRRTIYEKKLEDITLPECSRCRERDRAAASE